MNNLTATEIQIRMKEYNKKLEDTGDKMTIDFQKHFTKIHKKLFHRSILHLIKEMDMNLEGIYMLPSRMAESVVTRVE